MDVEQYEAQIIPEDGYEAVVLEGPQPYAVAWAVGEDEGEPADGLPATPAGLYVSFKNVFPSAPASGFEDFYIKAVIPASDIAEAYEQLVKMGAIEPVTV